MSVLVRIRTRMFGLTNSNTKSGVLYTMYKVDVLGLTRVRLRSLSWYLRGPVS
eukprot:jgi/Botrbrau1/4903/Bobra.118_1s0017.1